MLAAAHGKTDCVQLLIDAGADKDVQNDVRRRSLLCCCAYLFRLRLSDRLFEVLPSISILIFTCTCPMFLLFSLLSLFSCFPLSSNFFRYIPNICVLFGIPTLLTISYYIFLSLYCIPFSNYVLHSISSLSVVSISFSHAIYYPSFFCLNHSLVYI
jgi:hypothetical protein